MFSNRTLVLIVRSSRKFSSGFTSYQQPIQLGNSLTQKIHENISLKHSGKVIPLASRHLTTNLLSVDQEVYVSESRRPLTLILSWLAAKEKHIEKYRTLWLKRGFDVLTVKMTPYQFLAPTLGAQLLITDLIKILCSVADHYPDIILHCFSVGAYEFGEIFRQLDLDKINEMKLLMEKNPKEIIEKRIKGIIFDSAVDIHNAAHGISKSITKNVVLSKFLENFIKAHMNISYDFTTKHYLEAASYAYSNRLKNAPALLLFSNSDLIGTPETSMVVVNNWEKNGIDVNFRCFQKSGHVQHLNIYPDEYEKEVNRLLGKVKFESI